MSTKCKANVSDYSLELVNEILPGDTIWVRFIINTPEFALSALADLIQSRGVTSGCDRSIRQTIEFVECIADDARWVTLDITEHFDMAMFRRTVFPAIDRIRFIKTEYKLIDTKAVLDHGALIRFSFRDEDITGVLDLLELNKAGVIFLSEPERLKRAFLDEKLDRYSRHGTFRSSLNAPGNELYLEIFTSRIARYLAILRK